MRGQYEAGLMDGQPAPAYAILDIVMVYTHTHAWELADCVECFELSLGYAEEGEE